MVLKTGMLASGNLGSDLCELSIGQCQSSTRKYPVVAAVTIQGARNIQNILVISLSQERPLNSSRERTFLKRMTSFPLVSFTHDGGV